MDSPGPITKTVADAALLLNHLAGHDERDATTSPQPVPDFTATLGKDIKGLRIGALYSDLAGLEGLTEYTATLKELERLGAKVELAKSMDPRLSIAIYTVVQRGEVSSNLARYTGVRSGHDRSFFGAEAKRRIMLGTYTLSKGYADQYYTLAQKVRTLFIQDYARLFDKYDLLVSPTTPSFAKPVGATEGAVMFGELEDMLLEPTAISGLPGISVPSYRDAATNLFLGLNIIAPMWQEAKAIQVADAFERATTWNTWRNHV
jgi:aspartyl-tRNA(Asn)/glutamyl-tRNA(Gln) amidotransferase subunit A